MDQEIERKWLVVGDPPIDRQVSDKYDAVASLKATQIEQGYFDGAADAEVRVRIYRPVPFWGPESPDDCAPWGEVQIKHAGKRADGEALVRPQSDPWRVSIEMAEALMAACMWKLSKVRYVLPIDWGDTPAVAPAMARAAGRMHWEVDVYPYQPSGQRLVVVELELPTADFPLPPLPPWIGQEVTGEALYSNRTLAGGDTAERWQRLVSGLEAIAGAPLEIGVRPDVVAAVDAADRAALRQAIAAGRVRVAPDEIALAMAAAQAPAPHADELAQRAAQLTAARQGAAYFGAQPHDPVAHVASLPNNAPPPPYVKTAHGAARIVATAPPPKAPDQVLDLGVGASGKPVQIAISGSPDADDDAAELDLFEVDPTAPAGERVLQALGPNEPPAAIADDGEIVWEV